MPVFACVFHIKEQLTHSLSYTSKGKHPLYCADFFSFSFFYFSPFLSEPRKGALIQSPRNKPGGLSDHTQSSVKTSSWLFFLFYLIHVYFLPPYLPAHFTLSHPKLDRGRVEAMCPMLHVFIATLAVCLRVLMWTVEKMVTWYDIWACETTQSAGPWTQGVQALFFNASAVPRVSELNEINPPLSQYLWLEVSCVTSRWKTGCANRVSLYD